MKLYEEQKAATMAALADPQVGDRFHEMYSFWVYVTAVDGDTVTTLEGSPPCTMPDDGIQRVQSKAEFLKRFSYGTIAGSWVMLAERGNDVTGWARTDAEAAASKARGGVDAGL